MANPLVLGTLTTLPNGPGTGTDNLTALPGATALGLGVLDLSAAAVFDCLIAPMRIKSGATGTLAAGTFAVWVITSEDNAVWTDGISPTSAADQSAKLATAVQACLIGVTVNATTYYTPEFSLLALLGFVPRYAAVVGQNLTGHALDTVAASFYAKSSVTAYA